MFKFLNKKKNNKGFTLVELVIVVAILAILVGVLAPQYTKYVEKSRKAADVSNLENLVTVFKTAASDSTDSLPAGTYKITIGNDATTVTGDNAYLTVLNEFAGNDWANTRLRSKEWAASATDANEISATIVIGADGSVTVTYTPADLKNK